MRRRLTSRSVALFALFAFAFAGQAEARDYVVEVLVFERLAPGATEGNVWPTDPGWIKTENTSDLGSAEAVPVAAGQYALAGVAGDLESSGLFRPVYHTAWLQPRYSSENGPGVRFTGGNGSVDVEGVMRMYAVRDVHIDIDLIFKGGVADSVSPGGLRLRAQRRMKLNQINYLDHPLIGAFVQVRR